MSDRPAITVGDGFRMGWGLLLFLVVLAAIWVFMSVVLGISWAVILSYVTNATP